MPAVTLPVDPARVDGEHLVADLPAGHIPLPGDTLTVTDPHGRTGIARVACTDLARKRLYLAVTWPHPARRVPAAVLSAAVHAAGGTIHPAELAAQLTADQEAPCV